MKLIKLDKLNNQSEPTHLDTIEGSCLYSVRCLVQMPVTRITI